MLNWLRELLGEPAPVHIHFDKGAVAVASPGDVVIMTSLEVLRPVHRERVHEFLATLKKTHPDFRFIVLEPPLSGSVKGTDE